MKSVVRFASLYLVLAWTNAFAQEQSLDAQYVDVKGGELAYRLGGSPEGEVVLFCHGTGMADSFYRLLSEPALADYRLILYHRRGHGESSNYEGTMTREEHTDDVVTLLRHLEVGKAHVIGHSAGGFPMLVLADAHPSLVQSVMVMESPISAAGLSMVEQVAQQFDLDLEEAEEFLRRQVERAQAQRKNDPAFEAEQWLQRFGGENWETELAPYFPGVYEQLTNDLALSRAQNIEILGTVDAGFYDRISQPVANVWSEDRIDRAARDAFEHLPNIELRFLPGMGHEMMIMHPEPVAELIADWLGENPIQ